MNLSASTLLVVFRPDRSDTTPDRTRTRARRLRRLAAAIALLALLVAAPLCVAYVSAPAVDDFGARVDLRIAETGAHAVSLRAVAPLMQRALVVTEDERFYQHHGVDVIGVVRAIEHNVARAGSWEGASTLTQQLAKLLYLRGDDHNPWRKLQDAALALRIEQHTTKASILDAYLNTAYFGAGAYGIANASRRYFATTAGRLTLAQASLLAGVVQAPSAYDPFAHPRAARARQVAVLRSMVRDHVITTGAARRVLRERLTLADGRALPAAPGVEVRASSPPLPDVLAIVVLVALAASVVFAVRRLIALVGRALIAPRRRPLPGAGRKR